MLILSSASIEAHTGLDGSVFVPGIISTRTNGVRPDTGGNYERLRVVYEKRIKGTGGALHRNPLAFNQVQNVYRTLSVVRHRARKPVPPGLDKFELMKAGSLFAPAVVRS